MKPFMKWRDGPRELAPNTDSLTVSQEELSFTVREKDLLFIILNTDTYIDNRTLGDIPLNWLQKELEKSKEDLEARKAIERAKGILMDKRDVSESEAFASRRKLAMQESITIKQVADKILSVASLLGDNF